MKRHIGTGKKVIGVAWIAQDKAQVTYDDFSKQTLSRSDYQVLIKEVRS